MRLSNSLFLPIRGLRYHVRTWGDPSSPKLFLLHGWMDVAASFQFLVDELEKDWYVLAPDWRGYGLTEWPQDGYWFADYVGDLDALVEALSPSEPVNLVGHSLGGNVAGMYAGLRPSRVRRLISLEGFGVPTGRRKEPTHRACVHPLGIGCMIGGVCYADGATNPVDPVKLVSAIDAQGHRPALSRQPPRRRNSLQLPADALRSEGLFGRLAFAAIDDSRRGHFDLDLQGGVGAGQASNGLTSSPLTSVSRKSRPSKRWVNFVCSMPNKCRMVACRS